MADEAVVTEIAPGTFRVEHAGKREIVYVAGLPGDRWAFWNGHVFHSDRATSPEPVKQSLWRPPPGGPTVVRLKPDATYGDSNSTWRLKPDSTHGDSFTGSALAHPPAVTHARVVQSLSAPMPATVIKVLASPGLSVKKGDTLVVLEAMKMEWPIRALSAGTIKAVHCREGQLVQPDQTLIDLE